MFEWLVFLINNRRRGEREASVAILGEIHGNLVLTVLNVTRGASIEQQRAAGGVVAVGGFVQRSLARLVAKVGIGTPIKKQFD